MAFTTKRGSVYVGDSLEVLKQHVKPGSVDLIMTSPPFGLVRKKERAPHAGIAPFPVE